MVLCAGAVGVLIALVSSRQKMAAEAVQLKREAEERDKVDKIMDGVNRLSEHDVRQRLHDIAGKK